MSSLGGWSGSIVSLRVGRRWALKDASAGVLEEGELLSVNNSGLGPVYHAYLKGVHVWAEAVASRWERSMRGAEVAFPKRISVLTLHAARA